MSAEYTSAIAALQTQLQKEQQKVRETKKLINKLSELDGIAVPFPEANADEAESVSIGSLRRDLFYGVPLATAIRKYLEMRRSAGHGPATVSEIYNTLKAGGYKFGTEDELNAKRGLYTSLNKNSTTFHRVQSVEGDKDRASVFGLVEWYENIKASPAENGKKKRKRGKKKGAKKTETVAPPSPTTAASSRKSASVETKPDAKTNPDMKSEKGVPHEEGKSAGQRRGKSTTPTP